jgi:hypothetical protein
LHLQIFMFITLFQSKAWLRTGNTNSLIKINYIYDICILGVWKQQKSIIQVKYPAILNVLTHAYQRRSEQAIEASLFKNFLA